MSRAYYNEIDPAAAHLLRCLIEDGVIADGDVDERSIIDVQPEDLKGYTQVHLFSGGGLWSVALRMAGWDDGREVWSGSCPCQPFSVAGKGAGVADERHLWPHFHRLVAACRPRMVFGEQVSGAAGFAWFDGVAADLEAEDYACRAYDIPACAVNAPHIRQRLYWCAVADADRGGRAGRPQEPQRGEERGAAAERSGGNVEHATGHGISRDAGELLDAEQQDRGQSNEGCERSSVSSSSRCGDVGDTLGVGLEGQPRHVDDRYQPRRFGADEDGYAPQAGCWDDAEWLVGADGKSRRAEPGIRLLSHGIPNRVAALRVAGNAIVPALAAQFVAAVAKDLED